MVFAQFKINAYPTQFGHHISKIASFNIRLPLYGSKVPAGFPSPADDYLEDEINLDELIGRDSPTSFLVRVKGDSMIDEGIRNGDILIVDRSITPSDGKTVVVAINREFTVKKLKKQNGKLFLVPANKKYHAIEIDENTDIEFFGVVVSCIHWYK